MWNGGGAYESLSVDDDVRLLNAIRHKQLYRVSQPLVPTNRTRASQRHAELTRKLDYLSVRMILGFSASAFFFNMIFFAL
jgi:hypothetical protein